MGGAVVGATPADGASVAIQQLLPREVLDPSGAEPLGVFQVDGLKDSPGLEGVEQGVQGRRHHVHVFREGYVYRKSQDDEQVEPPGEPLGEIGDSDAHASVVEGLADGLANDGFRVGSAVDSLGLHLGHVEGLGEDG